MAFDPLVHENSSLVDQKLFIERIARLAGVDLVDWRSAHFALEGKLLQLQQLQDGESVVLPKTQKHARDMYTVIVAIMKSYGDDPEKATGGTSDGYHTFDELYMHRHALFIALMKKMHTVAWYSDFHADGTMYAGWFVAGIELPPGGAGHMITYHMPRVPLWDMVRMTGAKLLGRAPEWDGHKSKDVLERLAEWTVR